MYLNIFSSSYSLSLSRLPDVFHWAPAPVKGVKLVERKKKPLPLFGKGANVKQDIISYERIWVGNLAVMTRWFSLCRQHRGAYSNTWWPWQQNNIRRGWSDELALPKTKRWMAGWKLCRSTKDLIHTQQKSHPISPRHRRAHLHSCLFRHPREIRCVNLFLAFTVGKTDASTINEA